MSRVPTRARRLTLALVIMSSCIGCDQATKSLATQSLRDSDACSFFAGTLRLEYALNPGGFLSLGSNLPDYVRPWFFVGCNVCLMLVIFAFLIRQRNLDWKLFVAVSYILAGGIGNLIDRVSNNGLVTDFLNVGIGPLRTGVFNVADMAVMFGGLAAVFLTFRDSEDKAVPVLVVADGASSNGDDNPHGA
jgi:signal peptidase II